MVVVEERVDFKIEGGLPKAENLHSWPVQSQAF